MFSPGALRPLRASTVPLHRGELPVGCRDWFKNGPNSPTKAAQLVMVETIPVAL